MLSLKNRNILYWVIGAVALRVILSTISFHTDVQAYSFAGWVIIKGNILNFYDFIGSCATSSIVRAHYPPDMFNYPPAAYFLHGFFYTIFSIFFTRSFLDAFVFNYQSTLYNSQLYLHLILLKLPYILFDIPAAFFIAKLFDTEKNQLRAFLLWLFNPISLYATYLMGQHDIFPTFFVIVALYIVIRQKKLWSIKTEELAAIALGLGAAFKVYPLLFLIPLASLKTGYFSKIKVVGIGILTYILTILPFLSSPGFRTNALLSGVTLKSSYAELSISGGESIIYYGALILFFYLVFLSIKGVKEIFWEFCFLILLLFFIFTHYHPQWLLWLTPFLVIDLVKNNFKNLVPLLIILFAWFGGLWFFDSGLTTGLFSPLIPATYQAPTLWQLLGKTIDINYDRSLLQTLFVGGALFYIYLYFPRKSDHS